jgi:hypothetical protein
VRRTFLLAALFAVLPAAGQHGVAKPQGHSSAQEDGISGGARAEDLAALTLDRAALDDGGTLTVRGQAPPGSPVFLEVWSERRVTASFFDTKRNGEGVIPYRLYRTRQLPAHYRIYLPRAEQPALDAYAREGSGWVYPKALGDTGADAAFVAPAAAPISTYQATLGASVAGSRGDLLPALDSNEARLRAMQIVEARFRSVSSLLAATVEQRPDGAFTARVTIPAGAAPGRYSVVASARTGRGVARSPEATLENRISFPLLYLPRAGTSLNLFAPFVLALAASVFGVLMGAGGAFILNPLLVSLWPLPHTIVAGTVMPTVLFSQGSGIYGYGRIRFISWKLGLSMGLAMLAGGFIGPKLTELITLDQSRSVLGWILIVLAALMLWQTTPGYLARHRKEQAVLTEFRRRTGEEAAARVAAAPGIAPRGSTEGDAS